LYGNAMHITNGVVPLVPGSTSPGVRVDRLAGFLVISKKSLLGFLFPPIIHLV